MLDRELQVLADKIRRGECTPFLGAGISAPHIPVGGALSEDLAQEYGYPLRDRTTLPRVAQYIATAYRDTMYVKNIVADRIKHCEDQSFDFSDRDQPHRILADFRLPIYLTTNYDLCMTRALEHARAKPVTTVSRWNYETRINEPDFDSKPSMEQPVVFHLHGNVTLAHSILLTEDDYIDFSCAAQERMNEVIPIPIQRALSMTSLLFVGYSLSDWNFRILLRSLMRRMGKSSQRVNMSVQLPPGDDSIAPDRRDEAKAFLSDYLGTEQVQVHWGDAGAFLRELRNRVGVSR
jgi:hypothetical protein